MTTQSKLAEGNTDAGMAKIRIPLPAGAWHGVEAEWLWGKPMQDSIYALYNTPFYAFGVSYGDQVRVEKAGETLTMTGVVSRGGHSTYRVFAKNGQDDPPVQALMRELNELHCGIEGATKKLIAVDVLPEADIHKVYAALQRAASAGIIDFEEGHCGHPLGKAHE